MVRSGGGDETNQSSSDLRLAWWGLVDHDREMSHDDDDHDETAGRSHGDYQHDGHDHDHHNDHGHGHHHDQGLKGAVRYLRHGRRMWNSEINNAVIELADPKPGERALDIGAGMGPGAALAAKRGADVVAVEPTPFLRKVLAVRSRLPGSDGRIDVSDGSAERLPAADDSIDVLWAVNSMHHWVDPDVAVVEIVRVLKADGRLVLVDENFTDPDHPDYETFGGEGHGPEHHGFTMVDVEKLGERLTDLGMVDVVAGQRMLGARPVFAITASVP